MKTLKLKCRRLSPCAVLGGAVLLLAGVALANGQLKVVGEGDKQELAVDQFAPAQREAYTTFKARCTKCHAMARPIAALQTGVTPISSDEFEKKGIKKYVVKMMRKPNSGISKKDAKAIVGFLQHARGIAKGK